MASSVQRISCPSFLYDLIVFVGKALKHRQHRGLAGVAEHRSGDVLGLLQQLFRLSHFNLPEKFNTASLRATSFMRIQGFLHKAVSA